MKKILLTISFLLLGACSTATSTHIESSTTITSTTTESTTKSKEVKGRPLEEIGEYTRDKGIKLELLDIVKPNEIVSLDKLNYSIKNIKVFKESELTESYKQELKAMYNNSFSINEKNELYRIQIVYTISNDFSVPVYINGNNGIKSVIINKEEYNYLLPIGQPIFELSADAKKTDIGSVVHITDIEDLKEIKITFEPIIDKNYNRLHSEETKTFKLNLDN